MRKDEFPLIDTYTKIKVNDVLNKIRAEIETDLSNFCFDDWGNETNEWKEVKAIIDKYRTESEDKE